MILRSPIGSAACEITSGFPAGYRLSGYDIRAAAEGDLPRIRELVRDDAAWVALGYDEMRLDTLPMMGDAQRLYVELGFRDIPPYYGTPIERTRFMALRL